MIKILFKLKNLKICLLYFLFVEKALWNIFSIYYGHFGRNLTHKESHKTLHHKIIIFGDVLNIIVLLF